MRFDNSHILSTQPHSIATSAVSAMENTDIRNPEYFHQVVDCQYSCPAHTPVPEYIRLIAREQYGDAYMVNWESNVFPGILGRTCDRPCEPACRRGRLKGDDEEPVAICRLKRVAADHKGDIRSRLPKRGKPNGKRVALVGAGPASLTVARDLLPMGYEVHIFDEQEKGGGMMRSQIPAFRLPESVLYEEVDYVLDMGAVTHFNCHISSMKDLLAQSYDAIFVGTGAPRGRNLEAPGRAEADAHIHVGIEWLASVAFGHVERINKRVLVLGGGNTAMDCCRTARRLGGADVRVVVRSPYQDMKASPWEISDAKNEGIPMIENHQPLDFVHEDGRLVGMHFQIMEAVYDENGKRTLNASKLPPAFFPCDEVLIAIGQENTFPWIERDIGMEFDQWEVPKVDADSFQSTLKHVFFGGDAAFGPENIITAVAHGHQAAISIDKYCRGKDVSKRLPPRVTLAGCKMGIHEWSYDSAIHHEPRYIVPHEDKKKTLKDRHVEVEMGFDQKTAYDEAQRCLNCDVQTVFSAKLCIECDACVDICPTDCISFVENDAEPALRDKLTAPAANLEQPLYVQDGLKTGRVMVKDEDVCLHCGLCAERCPTSAWDMQQFLYNVRKSVDFELLAQDG